MNRRTVAHAPDHRGTTVNPDADPEGLSQFFGQRFAQPGHALDHSSGRQERLATTFFRTRLDAE